MLHANGGGTLQSFTYTLDAVGNRKAVVYGAGTESYTLDNVNRVTAVDYPTGDDVSYTYDANGNIATMTVGATTTTYTHNDGDQLTSDGTNTYTYDNNGNMTAGGTDTFAWDYADRMTSSTVGGTTTAYAYDGEDTRKSKTTGGVTTNNLYDRESGLPLVVDDGTNAFLHSDGILAEFAGTTPEYLLDDGLGSVRGLADVSGTLVGTANYNVFGGIRSSAGAGSVFGFTGEQRDAEIGYTYLRARYLNPTMHELEALQERRRGNATPLARFDVAGAP